MYGPPWGRGSGGWRSEQPPADDAITWVAAQVPNDWFVEPPVVTVDRDEVVIVGKLAEPESEPADRVPRQEKEPRRKPSEDSEEPESADRRAAARRAAAEEARIGRFREETRQARIEVAQQIEHRYRRKVGWGAVCGGSRVLFTTLSAPVMTRLRQPERAVLDTLVDAGVARSRSDALAWCVRLVGENAEAWLEELREAMEAVDQLRRRPPDIV